MAHLIARRATCSISAAVRTIRWRWKAHLNSRKSAIFTRRLCAGEMKHGPIALIDEAVPVIVLAPSGPLFEKTVSNMQEVRARGGKIVLISDAKGLAEAGEGCLATIEMPRSTR